MKIVFMGTPDFASCCLKRLVDEKADIAAVFTKPDRPKGRGMSLSMSPVKELALENNIPVFQPEKLRNNEEALSALREINPDIIVVVAYGCLLPDEVLSLPRYGCINIHGSLLPRFRGSSPIQSAVLEGDDVTGVSSMYLAHDMDAGDVIYTAETPIGMYETSGELFDRLMELGAGLLSRTLKGIEDGSAPRIPQDHSKATYTRMLDKSDCPIDWDKTPKEIIKKICGLDPWPVATAELAGKTCKIYKAEYTDTKTGKAPGEVVSAGKTGIEIACAGGETVRITELQAPGKKRMKASDFLLGNKL